MKNMEDLKKRDVFHIGKHCEESSCNRLDFLPVKCDGCSKTFCNDHFRYEKHHCSSGRTFDNQVPVCPLCNTPISVKRGEIPDIRIGQHIDNDCKSDTAVKRKIYTNSCSVKGCKRKEMMKVDCQNCRNSFCLAHRLPEDHQCSGPVSAVSKAGSAALARFASSHKPSPTPAPAARPAQAKPSANSKMSEDEALARALQMSLSAGDASSSAARQRQNAPSSQEEEDLALAQALAASEAEYRRSQQNPPQKANCVMS